MKMKFWLIQRGKFNKLNNGFKGLTGREGLIDLDYMGSSEFEWGAIPKAYRRIMYQFHKYNLIKTKHQSKNGVPMWIFCNMENQRDILSGLDEYLADPYRLKEASGLESYSSRNVNFWWEIESGIDFIFFYGATDRKKAFEDAINYDFNEWWMKKGAEEREKDIQSAFA